MKIKTYDEAYEELNFPWGKGCICGIKLSSKDNVLTPGLVISNVSGTGAPSVDVMLFPMTRHDEFGMFEVKSMMVNRYYYDPTKEVKEYVLKCVSSKDFDLDEGRTISVSDLYTLDTKTEFK